MTTFSLQFPAELAKAFLSASNALSSLGLETMNLRQHTRAIENSLCNLSLSLTQQSEHTMSYTAQSLGLMVSHSYADYQAVFCPFHFDSHASAMFYNVSGDFFCLGCGVRLSIAKLVEKLGISDFDIDCDVQWQKTLPDFTEPPFAMPLFATITDSVEGMRYAHEKRGIDERVLNFFDVQWDDVEERVVFPQTLRSGQIIGFVARTTRDGEYSRYVRFGKTAPLWPLEDFDTNDFRILFVSEGPWKTMITYQAALDLGIKCNSMCTFGARLTSDAITLLQMYDGMIIFIGDDDDTGRRHIGKVAEMLAPKRVKRFVPKKPFDEMTDKECTDVLTRIYESATNDTSLSFN